MLPRPTPWRQASRSRLLCPEAQGARGGRGWRARWRSAQLAVSDGRRPAVLPAEFEMLRHGHVAGLGEGPGDFLGHLVPPYTRVMVAVPPYAEAGETVAARRSTDLGGATSDHRRGRALTPPGFACSPCSTANTISARSSVSTSSDTNRSQLSRSNRTGSRCPAPRRG